MLLAHRGRALARVAPSLASLQTPLVPVVRCRHLTLGEQILCHTFPPPEAPHHLTQPKARDKLMVGDGTLLLLTVGKPTREPVGTRAIHDKSFANSTFVILVATNAADRHTYFCWLRIRFHTCTRAA